MTDQGPMPDRGPEGRAVGVAGDRAVAGGEGRTIVVGGGLAGLLAARSTARAGRSVLLLEAGPALGGAIAAGRVAGVPLSTGAEAYSVAGGHVDALLEELGLDGSAPGAAGSPTVVTPRAGLGSRIVSDAGTHPAPSGSVLGVPSRPLARDARAVLGLAGSLRAALEPLLPARIGSRPGASVDAVIRARCGARVAERLVAPIVGGVHSADPRTLELASASPQLAAGLTRHGSLTAAVRAITAESARRGSPGTRVRSLAPTMGALPEALAAEIRAHGGEIRTEAPVRRISRGADGGWTVALGSSPAVGAGIAGAGTVGAGSVSTVSVSTGSVSAEELVLAVPPDTARDLLAEAAPTLSAAIPQAPAAAVRLVALVVDAPALDAFPAGTGALVAPGTVGAAGRSGVRAKALTHVSAKWEHVQAAARAALPEARSPHVLRLSYGRPGEPLPDPSGIVDLALADASVILGTPLRREDLLGSAVIDWDRAMRQARPGHAEALAEVTALLARPEHAGLDLAGTWRAGTGIAAIVRAATASPTPTPTSTSTSTMPSSTTAEGNPS
ncbi:protoporphyrinogen/coproporphyrinogen oxidase [Brachybacterium sp. NBEC-018]|uniref:protoporphyrinogen/coproporphyrinogen oxidase n=1 Tax=Brachybacterium sp. NBEC-018 TaxID=2996004 RepID=UPI002B216E8C|nr:FAD-dependent oxidoreductase [Brachybacterium sp. NBEC-018]